MAGAFCTPDLAAGLIKMLECRVCHDIMKPPIVQCMSGHNICSTCDLQLGTDPCPLCRLKKTEVRNLLAEEMCQKVLYPCKNTGCSETHLLLDMIRHEVNCDFRIFDCPINSLCLWKGMLCNILKHAETAHGTNVWHEDSSRTTASDFSESFVETTLVSSVGELFVWHCEYSFEDSKFLGALKYIGPMENASKFAYVFKLSKNGNRQTVKLKHIVLKETESFSEVFHEMESCIILDYNTIVKRFMNGTRLNYQLSVKICA
jgi:E3 ubiquitin-protein ligase SIAH1